MTLTDALKTAPRDRDGVPILPLTVALSVLSPSGAGVRDETLRAALLNMSARAYVGSYEILREAADPSDTWDYTVGLEDVDVDSLEDVEPTYGYPWASYATWRLPDGYDAAELRAAGFIVAAYTPSGETFFGVDGGGYDFLSAHWGPLYLRHAADRHAYGWTVETDAGPIRVVPDDDPILG